MSVERFRGDPAKGKHEIRLALTLALLAGCAAEAAPFPTRDQNPLLAGFGLPMAMPARVAPAGEWSFSADLNWGSTALAQRDGTEALMVDAETREARLTVRGTLNNTTAIQIQVPYRYMGGGTLDGFIDSWHDAFNLPEGARNSLPEDEIHIDYRRNGSQLIDVDTSSSSLGDVSVDVGRELMSSPSTSAVAWLNVKAPTGDSDKLAGSGAIDASLIVAAEHRFSDSWTVFGQAAVTHLGDGDLLPRQQRNVVWSGLAGIGWQVLRAVELKLQFDTHTAVFDETELDYLGDAVFMTVGGNVRFNSRWQLDLAVSEDIVTEASPDVVFVIGIRRGLGE